MENFYTKIKNSKTKHCSWNILTHALLRLFFSHNSKIKKVFAITSDLLEIGKEIETNEKTCMNILRAKSLIENNL